MDYAAAWPTCGNRPGPWCRFPRTKLRRCTCRVHLSLESLSTTNRLIRALTLFAGHRAGRGRSPLGASPLERARLPLGHPLERELGRATERVDLVVVRAVGERGQLSGELLEPGRAPVAVQEPRLGPPGRQPGAQHLVRDRLDRLEVAGEVTPQQTPDQVAGHGCPVGGLLDAHHGRPPEVDLTGNRVQELGLT